MSITLIPQAIYRYIFPPIKSLSYQLIAHSSPEMLEKVKIWLHQNTETHAVLFQWEVGAAALSASAVGNLLLRNQVVPYISQTASSAKSKP